ncbi:acyl-ACP desaturase [Spirosoma utsteinense]|uniref:Acyl-[acyl-carrier-protein] desaturase n=1 Tax=Spirosoma utsteinense TaxID=2585773 RepID=A0ABR6W6Y6_9BACT|nr:acyl-ACP desaturase [Spirosoma utsteinense]MBC3786156.1 acyl-[acyl-carrier-protein] desaturase [Spirosoma utsteinense]MBC3792346.1 acyl-[acyl-carrier-protein] desaturase [Spirosoma utsteinense]
MSLSGSRLDVMRFVGEKIDALMAEYLRPIETNWQPTDLLPDSTQDNFLDEVKLLRESVQELPYDYVAVLIGDTITEEALPTYESWLMDMEGVDQENGNGWSRWIRSWTAEENRHGDLLNKFLYLSGRVNMRAMEVSTQYLIADGFDIGTGRDPYRNFIYTSFQELATNVSHRRTATLAKQAGCPQLSKICGVIASDEMRHAKAYKAFVGQIFEVDPSEMMLAFEDMMRKKIVMPAHFLRETGVKMGQTFSHFSDAAQRLGVYTTQDYIEIADTLLADWNIAAVNDLNDAGQRARDYLMALPNRLRRVADRTKVPTLEYPFSWIA